jgi:phosphatidylserine decarboxylase
MQTIKEFLDRKDIREIKDKHSLGKQASEDFFRDPLRTITLNRELFYAPADGVVLDIREVRPDEDLDIKGSKFTLKNLLTKPEYDKKSLVCSIFMTVFDVHINRVPTNCFYLEKSKTNIIQTHGASMLMEENDLLKEFSIKKQDMNYMIYNEKQVSKFYSPAINGHFYLVQIADKDIDTILNWHVGHFHLQGSRFGMIRFGSQVDMVIPMTKDFKYKALCKPLDHVEAGLDPIFKLI